MTRQHSPWLNDREQRAWRGLVRLQAELFGRLNRHIARETELSAPDYEVLVNLSEAPEGRLRVFELGAAMRWEKSRLSHHLRRMADRGLIAKVSCPSDARGAFVEITDAGRRAIEVAAPTHVAEVRRLFVDALSEEQLDQLAAIADAVVNTLDPEESCDEPA